LAIDSSDFLGRQDGCADPCRNHLDAHGVHPDERGGQLLVDSGGEFQEGFGVSCDLGFARAGLRRAI
jgi:hypothetical protein